MMSPLIKELFNYPNQNVLLTAHGGLFITDNPSDLIKILELEIKRIKEESKHADAV
tara:strand:- start:107 stop:274 length:168 start_codon:yes stop_codon:yes gene_type:complete